MVYHRAIKLGDDLYCYLWQGRGNNCNSVLLPGILRGKKPHVLIDPGHIRNEMGEACFASLTAAMERSGFSLGEVGLVIGTHSHPDHIEGTALVVEKNGALFALSREEDEFYATTGKKFFQLFGAQHPEVSPFFYLQEGDLCLGPRERKMVIKVLLTPGHSPGSISLYLEEKKVLISGDVVFAGSVGRTDFPGGSLSLLRKSIERLSRLEVDVLLAGHSTEMGSMVSGREQVRRNFYTVKMFF
jgi:glyoxylase-like metal-dependent hydrolase (beta-lactamase superfamily II)